MRWIRWALRAQAGLALLFAASCGPDSRPRDRCRNLPTFLVRIVTVSGSFPSDTRVSVEYGSGPEVYDLGMPHSPELVFCGPRTMTDGRNTGEAGAGGSQAIAEIVCELWTGGPATLDVTASGYLPVERHELVPDEEMCTVTRLVEVEPEPPQPER